MKILEHKKVEYEAARELNDDPYGRRCFTYAEDWANLMEASFDSGMPFEVIAKRTSREADYDGITGFMYGMAVSILSDVWVHGEQLRRWHNLDVQVGDEGERANASGGVINPALMTIGVPNKAD